MKRILLYALSGLVLLIALLVAISPLVLSHYTYQHYHRIVGQLIPRDNIKLKVLSYQRGWYTDHATVAVDLSNSPWRINGKDHVTFQQTIHLGPLVRQKHGRYRWQIARIENHYLDDKTDSDGEIIIHLNRSIEVNNAIDEIKINEDHDAAELSFLILHLESKPHSTDTTMIVRQLKTYHDASKNKPYVHANGIAVHNLKSSWKRHQKQSTQVQIDELKVQLQPKHRIEAKNVSIQKDSLKKKYRLSMHYQIGVEELKLDPPIKSGEPPASGCTGSVAKQRKYTQGNPKAAHHRQDANDCESVIQAIKADFTLSGLSPALIHQLSADLKTFLKPNMSNQWWLLQDVLRILSHGITAEIKQLQFTTPDGHFSVSGKIKVPPSAGEFHLLKPLGQLRADLEGTVPRQWLLGQIVSNQKHHSAKQAADRLADWIRAGVMQADKDQLRFSLLYKHGHFYLNSPDHHKHVRFYWVNHDKY